MDGGDGCERGIEVFVEMQKKKSGSGLWGGQGGCGNAKKIRGGVRSGQGWGRRSRGRRLSIGRGLVGSNVEGRG